METLLDHLKAVVSSLATSFPDLKRFLNDYTAIKDTPKRLAHLRVALKLDKFDLPKTQPVSDEYSNGAVLVELLQGALEFALDEGFPCNDLGPFLNLYIQTLTLIIQESSSDVSLSEVHKKFKTIILEYSNKLRRTHILSSVTFIRDTVLRHFRLYHYLLTQEQPQDLTTLKLDFPSPLSPLPLKDAQQEQEWRRTERIATLKSEQVKAEKELMVAIESASKEEENLLQNAYEMQLSKMAGQTEIREDVVRSLVESLATAHLQSTKVNLSQTLQRQTMLLKMKTEQLELLSSESALTKEE